MVLFITCFYANCFVRNDEIKLWNQIYKATGTLDEVIVKIQKTYSKIFYSV